MVPLEELVDAGSGFVVEDGVPVLGDALPKEPLQVAVDGDAARRNWQLLGLVSALGEPLCELEAAVVDGGDALEAVDGLERVRQVLTFITRPAPSWSREGKEGGPLRR